MGEFKNIFKELRTSAGLTQVEMAEKLNISRSTIGMYEIGNREPDFETLEKIADFFNVDIDYLLGRTNKTTILPSTAGENYKNSHPTLNQKDERDIAKDVNNIMEKLTSGEAGPAAYDGEQLSPEAAELFKEELEIALKRLKLINKEKYNPHKNKK